MNRNTLLLLIIFFTQYASAQTWVQKASMPSGGGYFVQLILETILVE